MVDLSNRRAGLALVIVSAASFGAMPIFALFAYRDGVDAVTMLSLRFAIATVVMSGLMAARHLAWPRGRALLGLAALGALGYVGQSFCYFSALRHAPAGLVALLLYLYPALVAVLAAIVLGESITRRRAVALVLAFGGAVLTVGVARGGTAAGVAYGVAAAVIYAVYIIAGTRLLRAAPAIPASTVVIAAAAVVYGVAVAARGPQWPASAAGWGWIAAVAVIGTVVAIVTFFAGVERIGPTRASTISTCEPVVSVVLAAAVLGERLSPASLAGGVLILAAVALLARER
ncbi:MAG TPA: DMT family transporter [Candidatus Krumholzibacteria bacterium]|nr:DMT family transporter [Candidatus Krumholzibacteria bacterium]HPD70540.1 DMT family transporter [Candidatus Krumholzibacteria bacterium]HRY39760.1 DMT family transporter [Candidatus Krumholzibacteria bacterium]